ncbi:MAG TPA: BrnA antitoxin family protein [Paracoccaceae bacterium]|nr:BrnA antitoxin family protein [Paracoccaceae bacterium]
MRRSKTQRSPEDFRAELMLLQGQLENWRRQRSLRAACPPDWSELETHRPWMTRKTRLTIRLDEDVAAWFRAQGPGYQTRMNIVLRAFMAARRGEVI